MVTLLSRGQTKLLQIAKVLLVGQSSTLKSSPLYGSMCWMSGDFTMLIYTCHRFNMSLQMSLSSKFNNFFIKYSQTQFFSQWRLPSQLLKSCGGLRPLSKSGFIQQKCMSNSICLQSISELVFVLKISDNFLSISIIRQFYS